MDKMSLWLGAHTSTSVPDKMAATGGDVVVGELEVQVHVVDFKLNGIVDVEEK